MNIQRHHDRCSQCLLCVRECVAGAWRNIGGEPVMAAPQLCNRCGHCVAVCSQSAIFHEALDYAQITESHGGNPDFYRHIVHGRRSIRQYKNAAVPSEIIENILNMASHSPTASNRQLVAYTVISDKHLLAAFSNSVFGFNRKLYEITRKGMGKVFHAILKTFFADIVDRYLDPMDFYISEADRGRDYILHKAPVLILVHGPRKEAFMNENCNIAAANIMNGAHAAGLGTCYIGFLTLAMKFSSKMRNQAEIPRGHGVFAALILGYPAYGHPFTVSRKKPQIHWIRCEDPCRINQNASS
jgi:nitroreductase/NAD-dependent dihydropyrimidine dehydrogenase PreA subunit